MEESSFQKAHSIERHLSIARNERQVIGLLKGTALPGGSADQSSWLQRDYRMPIHHQSVAAQRHGVAMRLTLRTDAAMQLPRTSLTAATLHGYAQLQLQIVKRGSTARHFGDVAVRDPVANANNHDVSVTLNENDLQLNLKFNLRN
jgi:hypothetical protein